MIITVINIIIYYLQHTYTIQHKWNITIQQNQVTAHTSVIIMSISNDCSVINMLTITTSFELKYRPDFNQFQCLLSYGGLWNNCVSNVSVYSW